MPGSELTCQTDKDTAARAGIRLSHQKAVERLDGVNRNGVVPVALLEGAACRFGATPIRPGSQVAA